MRLVVLEVDLLHLVSSLTEIAVEGVDLHLVSLSIVVVEFDPHLISLTT